MSTRIGTGSPIPKIRKHLDRPVSVLNVLVVPRLLLIAQFPENDGQSTMCIAVSGINPQGRFVMGPGLVEFSVVHGQVGEMRLSFRIAGVKGDRRGRSRARRGVKPV